MSVFDKTAADRLAYEVARLVSRGFLDERSRAADAVIDYMRIGGVDGPKTVPEWVEMYERRVGIQGIKQLDFKAESINRSRAPTN